MPGKQRITVDLDYDLYLWLKSKGERQIRKTVEDALTHMRDFEEDK